MESLTEWHSQTALQDIYLIHELILGYWTHSLQYKNDVLICTNLSVFAKGKDTNVSVDVNTESGFVCCSKVRTNELAHEIT